ncbi:hypothetical protein FNF31_03593 [Cafeteria roenbergensis]|uniref:protein-tyrosine-phosphatase n=1 Tax=Cafeteria roenbergensis TaxID=33653 RepID=A0A5A8DB29_CAFRO|nr:hypothetical protein FNF31_03593 [Cafeteria roenbergensis]
MLAPEAPRRVLYRAVLPLLDTSSSGLNDIDGGVWTISADTLARAMRLGGPVSSRLLILDCRFTYEFDGGHIKGAHSVPDASVVDKYLQRPAAFRNRIVVMHCEFSQKRGPRIMRFFRNEDRRRNGVGRPLDFPQLFLLHKGYSHFYEHHRSLCIGGYQKMDDDTARFDGAEHAASRAWAEKLNERAWEARFKALSAPGEDMRTRERRPGRLGGANSVRALRGGRNRIAGRKVPRPG